MSDVPPFESHDGFDSQEIVVRSRQTEPVPAGYAQPRILNASVSEPDDIAAVMQYLQVLWKHKWVLVIGVLAGALAGLGVSLGVTPMYRATTTLDIQRVQDPVSAAPVAAGSNLATEIQLISSATMRQRVVAKLSAKVEPPLPDRSEPLAPVRNILGLPDPAKAIGWREALGWAAGSTRITTTRESRILLIESQSPHPQAAADFTNTLAAEYILRSQEERWESYTTTGDWMARAEHELKTQVEESERRLAEFARANGLIITSGANISEDKLRQLQTELASASADRISKHAIYESSLSSPTDSLPEVLDSGPIGEYEVQIADLRRELAALSATLTPAHYRIQRVQAQIDELERLRERERKNVLGRIRIEYDAAQKREAQLQRDFHAQAQVLANQAEELIHYNILLREVETNKKLYEATLAQGKQFSLASAMRASNARVVDPAVTPLVPSAPSVPLNMTLGILGGLVCSAMFVVVRSTLDSRIQVPGTLGMLNLRELGVIPAARFDPQLRALVRRLPRLVAKAVSKSNAASLGVGIPREQGPHGDDALELVTWTQKVSGTAEAFRSAVTSILFSAGDMDQPRVILITSPAPQEGKTTVASNLAIAFSEINPRVLLIDADMRRPRLHTVFDLPNTFGLSDLLHQPKPIEEYVEEELVRKTHIPGLFVLPAGPARMNLSRLLYSDRVEELIRRFRRTFDIILIDTAPVLSVPDARILARTADGVVLVWRAHNTQQESAFAAVRSFEEDGRRILGTILNDWDPRQSTHGAYGQYDSYSPPYGSQL